MLGGGGEACYAGDMNTLNGIICICITG